MRTISAGEVFTVSSSQVETNDDIQPGGIMFVDSGGLANFTHVESSGSIATFFSGRISGTIIDQGGVVFVNDQSEADATAVAGLLNVQLGGQTSGTIVSNGGTENLFGGNSLNTDVLGGGTQFVSSGSTASNTVVEAGGLLILDNGAVADGSLVSSGATVSGLVLSAGVIDGFAPGYLIDGLTVQSGAAFGLTIEAGASTTDFVLSNTFFEDSGGESDQTTVAGGATLQVDDGGFASVVDVTSGGLLHVESGGNAHQVTVESGGEIAVDLGGDASAVTVESGGIADLTLTGGTIGRQPGGFVVGNAVISRGAVLHLTIEAGVTISRFNVSGDNSIVNDGGLLEDIAIGRGGTVTDQNGGVDSGTVINRGGDLQVFSGGTTSGAVVNRFAELDVEGGTAISALVQSDGRMFLEGGVACGTQIASGGILEAEFGVARATLFESGSLAGVFEEASLCDSVVSGSVLLEEGGTAFNSLVGNGGIELVIFGGSTSGTTVQSGGTETVGGGGFATDITVSSGGVLQVDHGALGDATIAAGGTLELAHRAEIDDEVDLTSATITVSGRVVLIGGGIQLEDSAIVSECGPALLVNDLFLHGGGTIDDANLTIINNDFIGAIEGGVMHIAVAQLINHGTITADAGGTLTIVGDVVNTGGTLNAGGQDVIISGSLLGTSPGQATIDHDGVLTITGKVAATQTIAFDPTTTGTLALGAAQRFAGTIEGFMQGDAIDLENFAFSKAKITGISGTGDAGTNTILTVQAGARIANIALLNDYAQQFGVASSAFQLVSDHQGATPGTLLELAPPPS